jgi:hypothetical protein
MGKYAVQGFRHIGWETKRQTEKGDVFINWDEVKAFYDSQKDVSPHIAKTLLPMLSSGKGSLTA